MLSYRLDFAASSWRLLDEHMATSAPNEAAAFMLLHPGRGRDGCRLVGERVLLPPPDGIEAEGSDHLRPSGQWLSAAVGEAIEGGYGLAFVHSHPGAQHPTGLSHVDQKTAATWGATLSPAIGKPFAFLVWTPAALNGVVVDGTGPAGFREVHVIQAAGDGAVHRLWPPPDDAMDLRDDRQQRVLGQIGNGHFRQLQVGLVGLGGTGSPLAEILARMGVRRIVLVDRDTIDETSLRRVVGSSERSIGRPKVEVVDHHLHGLGLGTQVEPIYGDVTTKSVARTLLDTDVVVSSTDNHGSRSFLSQLSSQYSLPLIDVGCRVGTSAAGGVTGMPVEVRTVLPEGPCLWCMGVLDAGRIRVEGLPDNEVDQLAREGYVQSVRGPEGSLAALNFAAASAAATQLVHLMANDKADPRLIVDAWEPYGMTLGADARADCICSAWRGRADSYPLPFRPPSSD